MFSDTTKAFDISFLRNMYKRNWTKRSKEYVSQYFAKSTIPVPMYIFFDADSKKYIQILPTDLKFHLPIKEMRSYLRNDSIHYKFINDKNSCHRVYQRDSGQWIINNTPYVAKYNVAESCFENEGIPDKKNVVN